jgi:hypothetical protein
MKDRNHYEKAIRLSEIKGKVSSEEEDFFEKVLWAITFWKLSSINLTKSTS